MPRTRARCLPAVLVALGVGLPFVGGCGRGGGAGRASPAGEPAFVGGARCTECHQAEQDLWRGSHHDLAMDIATPETVLGDFAGATLEHFGVVSRMFMREGRFLVETDGPDGLMHEYPVEYVFGVYPLQQYLVEFPGGRLQTLPVCWDSRPVEQGGQRWFHIYPNEPIPAGDELHWTGLLQNWNHMCAECHSTDLHKNYDLDTDSFDSTWSEIDVSCEACHGPGSAHIAWAEAERDGRAQPADPSMGMAVRLKGGGPAFWAFDPDKPTARRSEARTSQIELETCARCHARRGTLTDDYRHGRPILDSHRVALLDEGLYFADGQFLDEDYEYGSFRQSRMYHSGVTCSDCHDPHSARVYAKGNDLCAKCHLPTVFDVEPHHRHPGARGDPGTNCVDCHMPTRTYMVVDDRLDHSFRVPRPDLSDKLGAPNACTMCHADQTAGWAAEHVAEWFGPDRRQEWRFGEALHAGREGLPGAARELARLAGDPEQPAIARATGLTLFADHPGTALLEAVRTGAADVDGLVRLGAIEAGAELEAADRLALLSGLLRDPLFAVRGAAAQALAPVIDDSAPAEVRAAFEAAERDYIAGELANAERPETHVNLGGFYTDRARYDDAEREYRTALRLNPRCIPAAVNFADLRRVQGRDDDAERILREALRLSPQDASARHALGLTLVRLGRHEEGLVELERAAEWGRQSARYAYVFAIALDSLGQHERALAVLRSAYDRHPRDRAILMALVDICGQLGLTSDAARFHRELEALAP